jgi:hypothetical protein
VWWAVAAVAATVCCAGPVLRGAAPPTASGSLGLSVTAHLQAREFGSSASRHVDCHWLSSGFWLLGDALAESESLLTATRMIVESRDGRQMAL